jgi:heat shock protein 5
MSQPRSQTNHASSLPLVLFGAFLFICFAGTTQAFPWPWQSQKPLRDYSYYMDYAEVETDSTILGIHLGATYASGAIYRNGSVEMIPNKDGRHVIPNVVKFTDGEPLTGYDLEVDPAHTIFNMERLIGRNFNDPVIQEAIEYLPFKVVNVDNEPRIEIQVNSKKLRFSPQEISAIILAEIKKEAEEYLGANVTYAVITVPADFNDAQRVC